MTDDPAEAREWQVHQLTPEAVGLTRQSEHKRQIHGFLEERAQRLETGVHSKMSRVEAIGWAWTLVPLIVGMALVISPTLPSS